MTPRSKRLTLALSRSDTSKSTCLAVVLRKKAVSPTCPISSKELNWPIALEEVNFLSPAVKAAEESYAMRYVLFLIKSAPRGASSAILLLSPDRPSSRRIIGTSRASLLCPEAGDATRNRELSAPPKQSKTIALRQRLAQIRACNIFYLPRRLPPARSSRPVRPCAPAATPIAHPPSSAHAANNSISKGTKLAEPRSRWAHA